MERHVVVIAFAGEQLDALGMLRRQIVAQLDDDAALGRVDDDCVGLVETGRKLLGDRRDRADQRGKDCENADHGNSKES